MSNTIRREVLFPQTPEQVWQAITDRATLAEWMYPNDFEPRVGHRFTFQVPPNPKVRFDGLTVLFEELVEADDSPRLTPVCSAYLSSRAPNMASVSTCSAACIRAHCSPPSSISSPSYTFPADRAAAARMSNAPGSW